MDCPPLDACGSCGALPGGFVRLRYFFGKRMGVADFLDEQRYHVAKHRFHNQRLHGSGVLCGLAVSRMDPASVQLRVSRGAAVDPCGREILVGHDQCIDVDAWFRRALEERRALDATWPASALDASGALPLVVLVRYRDCATAPEPAPRDTCSCDAAGCDFGRVREEFELVLVTASDPEAAAALPLTPPRAAVDRVLATAVGGAAITRGLAVAASAGCGEPADDGWLVLARFRAVIAPDAAGNDRVTDLGAIEPAASLLAETALLQDLLARMLAAQLEAGALIDGPEVTALTVAPDGSELVLALSAPVIAATVPTGAFTLTRFDATSAPTWTSVAVSTAFQASPPRLVVSVTGGVVAGARYRLALDPDEVPPAAPIADDEMRPLRPLRGVFQFGIEKPAADFVVVGAPYV
jgi:hypothetical protein